jgi:hypothetical protein
LREVYRRHADFTAFCVKQASIVANIPIIHVLVETIEPGKASLADLQQLVSR